MSEGILKALIQLFALIAFPHKDNKSRRDIVRNFLVQHLSQQMVEEFLSIYEGYYKEHVSKLERLKKSNNSRVTLTSNSVKALIISSDINKELTHYQKLIVIIQLIEFINSGIEISHYEKDFLETIAQTLHISNEEFVLMYNFVIQDISLPVDDKNILIVGEKESNNLTKSRYLYWKNLKNKIHILHIPSSNLFLIKINDEIELNINGQILNPRRIHIFTPGSSIRNIRIDPIYYSDIVENYTSDTIVTPINFKVEDLSYKFKNKQMGVHPLSFNSESGRLVGIMGSSGAGKSTLINILSGIYKPYSGHVKINNIDIHKNPKKIEGLVGYVSQDDLLIEKLTVYQNLYYNAKLSFDNLNDFQIKKRVLNLLSSLGLYDIKDMKVGSPLNKKISGGQRKRLNIALELIREPAVLFLDEPTSGLSSRDSANILDLLKELALKGKLVFVVIHQPSSDIFKMFNQLLVLDTGGYLIYDGDPVECINYFKASINQANRQESECHTCGNVNPEQILNIVTSQVIDEYGSFTQNRKIEPEEWYNRFRKTKYTSFIRNAEKYDKLPLINFKIPNRLKQWFIFLRRDILSRVGNSQYLLINFLETPILAFLLASIIKYYNIDSSSNEGYTLQNNPNLVVYIIMGVIIALFVGLTVSAEEIIKDRKILKREEFLNLSRLSYLLSKAFILAIISSIQTISFVLIGNWIIEIKEMLFQYWIILFSAAYFSNLLGLIISDSFKDAINVYILIPFLVIPQIILSGVFISYDNLNPKISNPEKIPWYGEIITARWAFEALAVNQFKNNNYEKNFFIYDKIKSNTKYRKEYWIPTLDSKLDDCLKYYHSNDNTSLQQTLTLINNEIIKESKTGLMPHTPPLFTNSLDTIDFSYAYYEKINNYLNERKAEYIKVFNKADQLLDEKKKEHTKTIQDRKNFIKLKNNNFNLELERFVRNNNIFSNKIIVTKDKLIQKSDPIFKDADKGIFSAHFLCAYKYFGNIKISTFWANLIIIWIYNILLFILLYFGLLKSTLFNITEFSTRIKNWRPHKKVFILDNKMQNKR